MDDLKKRIEQLESDYNKLESDYDKLHQFAVGMFWAGERLPEKTANEIRAYGLDAKLRIAELEAALFVIKCKSDDCYNGDLWEIHNLASGALMASIEKPKEQSENTNNDTRN